MFEKEEYREGATEGNIVNAHRAAGAEWVTREQGSHSGRSKASGEEILFRQPRTLGRRQHHANRVDQMLTVRDLS